jgi:hypothetical protein
MQSRNMNTDVGSILISILISILTNMHDIYVGMQQADIHMLNNKQGSLGL